MKHRTGQFAQTWKGPINAPKEQMLEDLLTLIVYSRTEYEWKWSMSPPVIPQEGKICAP